jgi:enediyne biosynthesis protein E4
VRDSSHLSFYSDLHQTISNRVENVDSSSALKFLLLVMCLHTLSCAEAPLFTSLDADETGIDFINWNNETEETNIFSYEYLYNGGGVAVGDINNDGLADIYFSSNSSDNRLYLNKGNFRFEDITGTSGTACKSGWKTGVSFVDLNADGWLDIYVSKSANNNPVRRKNLLLINNQDNTFTDRASEFGLDDPSYSTQAAFFDHDRDGDLDAFILNHSLLEISNSFDITARNTTQRKAYVGNKLLENRGGHFVDISDSVGIYGPASNYGLGVSLSDINRDGFIDIYAGCDYTGRDRLLLNKEGKQFVDVTEKSLSHISKFTMGTDIADINGDGLMDIYTLDMLPEDNKRQKQLLGSDRYDVYETMVKSGLHHQHMRNMLHLNRGDGTFSEIGQAAGVSNTDWSWAALFADFDNDGNNDLLVSNGFKRDLTNNDFTKYQAFEEIQRSQRNGQPVSFLKVMDKFHENKIANYIFRGNGKYQFENVSEAWGLSVPSLSNGAAYGDLDNDGDLDIVINNINQQASVFRNNSETRSERHYLKVRLSSGGKNRNCIGAHATVYSDDKIIARELLPVRGFQSSVEPLLHFGLGNSENIDSLVIRWPDGQSTSLLNLTADHLVTVIQPAEESLTGVAIDLSADMLFEEKETDASLTHIENDFNDFYIQPLLPRMYSREGPAFASVDLNSDGKPDYFFGAASHGVAKLLLSAGNVYQPRLFPNQRGDQVDAAFFDADGDGDSDLYVVTGGYEASNAANQKDFLFFNDGKGGLQEGTLPDFFTSGSRVRCADIDADGDTDLFVPGRILPHRYPSTPESVMLLNDGRGHFSIATINSDLKYAGMVTDAQFINLNGDAFPDLVVTGEWMAIRFFINRKGIFYDESEKYLKASSEGLWNCLLAHDFDSDGDMDLVAGNYGINSQLRASVDQPLSMLYGDFDDNGSLDPVLQHYITGVQYPFPSRDELLEQIPILRKRFQDYKSYSSTTAADILRENELSKSGYLKAVVLTTSFLRNDNGIFNISPLPIEAQFAPLCAMALMDIDNDGVRELITGGNIEKGRARSGRMTGSPGYVFKFSNDKGFSPLSPQYSGIHVDGDVKHISVEGNRLLFVRNNMEVKTYQLKPADTTETPQLYQ